MNPNTKKGEKKNLLEPKTAPVHPPIYKLSRTLQPLRVATQMYGLQRGTHQSQTTMTKTTP